jgi:hypothetical protein
LISGRRQVQRRKNLFPGVIYIFHRLFIYLLGLPLERKPTAPIFQKRTIYRITRNEEMTSPTSAAILAMSAAADLPNTHAIRRPATFLSLAPTTSASYPQRPSPPASIASPKIAAVDAPAITSPVIAATEPAAATAGAVPETAAAEIGAVEELDASSGLPKHRRSSSLASDESASGIAGSPGRRFLKLGPVHWGEGDGKGDWTEVGVAE